MNEMAMHPSSDSPVPSAELVGNAFVEQYYQILYKSPEEVHNFYRDSSVISRPGPDGIMSSVTTMEGINDKIMSLDYKEYMAEIITADAQDSLMEGVIVLVTGCLIGKDNVKRNFTQIFFLARQDKGYYVLNDVFRFVDAHKLSDPSAVDGVDENVSTAPLLIPSAVNDVDENVLTAPLTLDSEPAHVHNHPVRNQTSSPAEGVSNEGGKVCDKPDTNHSVVEVAVAKPSVGPSQNDVLPVAELALNAQNSGQKMSYASILAKESMVTSPVNVPTVNIVRVAPSADGQPCASASPKASSPRSKSVPQSSNAPAEGKSIYIGNLPTDMEVPQLEGVIKKFGPVNRNGIQIKRFKDGFCYAFVEFESSNSVRSAIEAGKITFGEKESYIMGKKSVTQVANGRGRFSSRRSGLHNDNFRVRENFGEGRRHGRYENGYRGEVSGEARGHTSQNGEGYQGVYRNGGERVAH